MPQPRNKPKFFKRLFFSKIFVIIEIMVLVFVIYQTINILEKKKQRGQEIQSLKDKLSTLESSHNTLLQELLYIQSPSYSELEAKKQFNLKKSGETVVVIKEEQPEISSNEFNLENPVFQIKSNLGKWWEYFFSL